MMKVDSWIGMVEDGSTALQRIRRDAAKLHLDDEQVKLAWVLGLGAMVALLNGVNVETMEHDKS